MDLPSTLPTIRPTLSERIVAFFGDHATQAFTLVEIIVGVEGLPLLGVALTMGADSRACLGASYTDSLRALVAAGRVQAGIYNDQLYYCGIGSPAA